MRFEKRWCAYSIVTKSEEQGINWGTWIQLTFSENIFVSFKHDKLYSWKNGSSPNPMARKWYVKIQYLATLVIFANCNRTHTYNTKPPLLCTNSLLVSSTYTTTIVLWKTWKYDVITGEKMPVFQVTIPYSPVQISNSKRYYRVSNCNLFEQHYDNHGTQCTL